MNANKNGKYGKSSASVGRTSASLRWDRFHLRRFA
jgi:hypothetical protein